MELPRIPFWGEVFAAAVAETKATLAAASSSQSGSSASPAVRGNCKSLLVNPSIRGLVERRQKRQSQKKRPPPPVPPSLCNTSCCCCCCCGHVGLEAWKCTDKVGQPAEAFHIVRLLLCCISFSDHLQPHRSWGWSKWQNLLL